MMRLHKILAAMAVSFLIFGGTAFSHDHTVPAMESGGALPGTSIYHLTSVWTASDGRTLSLKELAGKPVIIAMAYTSCKDICPLIVADMMAIEDRITKQNIHDVGFVFVSLDPEHDTPERLTTYAKDHGLDPAHWTLLSSDAKAVRLLAAALGVRYRRVDATTIDHSTIISLLDQQGSVHFQRLGSGDDLADFISHVAEIAGAQP